MMYPRSSMRGFAAARVPGLAGKPAALWLLSMRAMLLLMGLPEPDATVWQWKAMEEMEILDMVMERTEWGKTALQWSVPDSDA
eukprot:scaffold281902_cov19-Tisochrysis_lutea.AAC.1